MSNFWDDAYNIVNKGYTATKTFLDDSFLNAQTPYQGPRAPKSTGIDETYGASSYQDFSPRSSYNRYEPPEEGFSWWNTAKDYAAKAGEYIDKGVGYVRKPLDYLKGGFDALPDPLQEFVRGRLEKSDDDPRPDRGGSGPQRPRFDLSGGGSSYRANFQSRQARGFRGAASTYANNPLAMKLINDAALNKRIREVAMRQLNSYSRGRETISIQQARNAIRTRLSKGVV